MNDTCIVSCCYSEGQRGYYDKYADRLEASLDKYAPGVDRFIWRDSWPTGSMSHGSHNYAFKYFAVADALKKGYRRALWLDAGCEARCSIEPLLKEFNETGYALLLGWDVLGEWVSDEALESFGVTREKSMELKLCGGCYIGIDSENELGMKFFKLWEHLAKNTQLFRGFHTEESKDTMRSILVMDGADAKPVSLDPRVKGHRSDEACFSLAAYKWGMKTVPLVEFYKFMKTY